MAAAGLAGLSCSQPDKLRERTSPQAADASKLSNCTHVTPTTANKTKSENGLLSRKLDGESANREAWRQIELSSKIVSPESSATFVRGTSSAVSSNQSRYQQQTDHRLAKFDCAAQGSKPRDAPSQNNNGKVEPSERGKQNQCDQLGSKAATRAERLGELAARVMSSKHQQLRHQHQVQEQRLLKEQQAARHQQSGAKLVSANLVENGACSPPRLKQHQPHCIHHQNLHKPHCAVLKGGQLGQAATTAKALAGGLADEEAYASREGAALPANEARLNKLAAPKYLKAADKSYLLVHYRGANQGEGGQQQQQQHHASALSGRLARGRMAPHETDASQQSANCNNGATIANKRTTIKFISQLYFLLHLSAILSLISHHKNLVTSERKLDLQTAAADELMSLVARSKRQPMNESEAQLEAHQSSSVGALDELPQPLMLLLQHKLSGANKGSPPVISSVVVSPHSIGSLQTADESNTSRLRHSRQAAPQSAQQARMQLNQPDILVRLVGHWHAKCALQYFLCYLLSSSITILICLRLARLCGWRASRHAHAQATRREPDKRADSSLYGFYYRTRLDCTPVLIGSISLGLIQLIVIGLDIASNVDWLGDNRWPIYLPFLQFAFVSLLMQFILGRVAKNAEEEKRNWCDLRRSSWKEKKEKASLSINEQQRTQRRRNNNNNSYNNEPGSPMAKCSPFSGGLQNIALAHLLVTHILLWLMKLNSISLFQAIEQQQHNHNRQQRGFQRSFEHNQQQPTNRFYSTLSPSSGADATQSTGAFSSTTLPSQTRELEQRQSRAELENILRRKSTPTSTTTVAPALSSSRAPELAGARQLSVDEQKGNQLSTRAPIVSEPTLATQLSNSTRDGAASGDASAKNARSTNRLPEATRTANELGAWLLASNQQAELLANLSSANSTPVTISKAQLLSLLSLAAKNERSLQEQLASHQQQQQQQQQRVANGSREMQSEAAPTPTPKPAIPKRMTAFRQTPRPSVLTATSSTAAPLQLNNASVPIKQRARVLVSHSTWDGAKEVPETESEERRRRAGFIKSLAEQSGATTERPFPSVDSDPPTPSSALGGRELEPMPALISSTTSSTTARPTLAHADKKLDSSRRAAIAAPTSNGAKPEAAATPSTSESSDEADAEEEEGPESDLDALLPPVPNYNETNDDELGSKREASQRQTRLADEPLKPAVSMGKRLPEEPFAFNEAASNLNLTITPISVERLWTTEASSAPELIGLNESARATNESASNEVPKPEASALSSFRQRRDEESAARWQQQPSFADYLLPIVYQYHILIIAILFNMWLDSLRKSPASDTSGSSERHTSKPRLLAQREPQAASSSASELGSVLSRSSSTRGLIAIPIKGAASRSYALERVLRPKGGAHQEQLRLRAAPLETAEHLRRRSRSMDLLQQQSGASELELDTSSSGLSRCNSLRSSSSERLLWIPSSQLRANNKCATNNQQHRRRLAASCSTLGSTLESLRSAGSLRVRHAQTRHLHNAELAASKAQAAQWRHRAAARRSSPARRGEVEPAEANVQSTGPTNSVCSVFFGLLVVSGSLIVILLGVDLLSVLSQCLTQLTSILVCLLGLLLIWRAEARQRHKQQLQQQRHKPLAIQRSSHQLEARRGVAGYHRQCFHYLFLLAAYYCGISIALNLGRQHSMAQLFSQQVVAFIQRHLSATSNQPANQQHLHWAAPIALTNYFYLFHLILAFKGALLIVQVTLQTVLIRSSCQQVTRELRQIYTFLMFANLSLWAMEICEQQQHLQQRQEQEIHFDAVAANNLATPPGNANNDSEQAFRLVTLDGFSRFAASIVTLSHLYHGLVFMQH